MNKIICSLFGFLILLFIIWCIVAYANYGNDMINYRIDLVDSFNKLNVSSDWATAISGFVNSGENLRLRLQGADVYFWEFINDTLSNSTDWWGLILRVVTSGLAYISKAIYYIYSFVYFFVDIVRAVSVWIAYSVWIVLQLINFIFKPTFVRVN